MDAYLLFGFQGRRLFEVGAYWKVGAHSNKYGIYRSINYTCKMYLRK